MFMRVREPMDGARPSAGGRPVETYLEVDDVDAYQGVKIASPLTTQWWGDRTFTVVDPYGYKIWFSQKQVGRDEAAAGCQARLSHKTKASEAVE